MDKLISFDRNGQKQGLRFPRCRSHHGYCCCYCTYSCYCCYCCCYCCCTYSPWLLLSSQPHHHQHPHLPPQIHTHLPLPLPPHLALNLPPHLVLNLPPPPSFSMGRLDWRASLIVALPAISRRTFPRELRRLETLPWLMHHNTTHRRSTSRHDTTRHMTTQHIITHHNTSQHMTAQQNSQQE